MVGQKLKPLTGAKMAEQHKIGILLAPPELKVTTQTFNGEVLPKVSGESYHQHRHFPSTLPLTNIIDSLGTSASLSNPDSAKC